MSIRVHSTEQTQNLNLRTEHCAGYTEKKKTETWMNTVSEQHTLKANPKGVRTRFWQNTRNLLQLGNQDKAYSGWTVEADVKGNEQE